MIILVYKVVNEKVGFNQNIWLAIKVYLVRKSSPNLWDLGFEGESLSEDFFLYPEDIFNLSYFYL